MAEPAFYEYRVEPRDIDFTQRATLQAIGDYILLAAGEDADRNRWGVRDLNAHNASWVLSRFVVETVRRPLQYERLRIETWVSEVNRIMTTRNFRVWDEHGALLGAAVSNWAMIDLSTRAPLDLSELAARSGSVCDEPSPVERPGKIVRVTPTHTALHTVAYSDLDFNRHANSMKYLQWMVDMLPVAWHEERHCRRYTIHFLREARYGETLELCFEDAPVSLFEIRHPDGTPVCRASLEW